MQPEQASQPSDGALRTSARDAIRSGRLPGRPPERIWGGQGANVACSVCGGLLLSGEVDLELEFAATSQGAAQEPRHVHVRCLTAWETELRALGFLGLPGSPGGGTMVGGATGTEDKGAST